MAPAQLIDGTAIAAQLRQRVAGAVAALRDRHGIIPGLASVLVGDDPASHIYVRNKQRACAAVGLTSFERELPGGSTRMRGDGARSALGSTPTSGSTAFSCSCRCRRISTRAGSSTAIDPEKDVDGFHPLNVGRLWSRRAGARTVHAARLPDADRRACGAISPAPRRSFSAARRSSDDRWRHCCSLPTAP